MSNREYTKQAIEEICEELNITTVKQRKLLMPLIKEGLKRYSGHIQDTINLVRDTARL